MFTNDMSVYEYFRKKLVKLHKKAQSAFYELLFHNCLQI